MRTPPSTPPSPNEYLPIIEHTVEDEPTMDNQLISTINPLLDAFYSPLTIGLSLLNYSPHKSVHGSPPVSVHSSPPISVHSSPPISVHSSPSISVHSSPPISVHSSSTSKATSPPISVASSRSKGSSPFSPSAVPVVYDVHSPSPSPDF